MMTCELGKRDAGERGTEMWWHWLFVWRILNGFSDGVVDRSDVTLAGDAIRRGDAHLGVMVRGQD